MRVTTGKTINHSINYSSVDIMIIVKANYFWSNLTLWLKSSLVQMPVLQKSLPWLPSPCHQSIQGFTSKILIASCSIHPLFPDCKLHEDKDSINFPYAHINFTYNLEHVRITVIVLIQICWVYIYIDPKCCASLSEHW